MATAETFPTPRRRGRIVHSLRIDMTPMVDLGFLLITFFIFTTALADPHSMQLSMPTDIGETDVAESKVLTALLTRDNRIYVYEGSWADALAGNGIRPSSYHELQGLGQRIRDKQKWLDGSKEGRASLVLLIKPDPQASYRNTIDALDEAAINGVKRYVLLKASGDEEAWLHAH